jgi:hypothetical protein
MDSTVSANETGVKGDDQKSEGGIKNLTLYIVRILYLPVEK